MILTPDQARRVQRGDRTTIRVPVDPRLVGPLRPVRKGQAKPFVPNPGNLVPIAHPVKRDNPAGGEPKDGWETICHVEILNIARALKPDTAIGVPLGHLTDQDAQAEGYDTANDFVWAWTQRYDRDWTVRNLSYLIEQGTDADDALETVRLMAANRYPDRWAARRVWLLTIRVQHDLDLHMERAATAKGEHGYTIGADQIDAGRVQPVEQLARSWDRQSVRRHRDAIEALPPRARAVRARELLRRFRALALQDPKLLHALEDLVRDAEQQRKQAA